MRIVTQEELDGAELIAQFDYWTQQTRADADCCKPKLARITGCTSECVHAEGEDWTWHGLKGERPTPESILVNVRNDSTFVMSCAHGDWGVGSDYLTYRERVHARAATIEAAVNATFDEATERARLMPV